MIELAVERYAGTGLGHSELCQQMHSHRRTTLAETLYWPLCLPQCLLRVNSGGGALRERQHLGVWRGDRCCSTTIHPLTYLSRLTKPSSAPQASRCSGLERLLVARSQRRSTLTDQARKVALAMDLSQRELAGLVVAAALDHSVPACLARPQPTVATPLPVRKIPDILVAAEAAGAATGKDMGTNSLAVAAALALANRRFREAADLPRPQVERMEEALDQELEAVELRVPEFSQASRDSEGVGRPGPWQQHRRVEGRPAAHWRSVPLYHSVWSAGLSPGRCDGCTSRHEEDV